MKIEDHPEFDGWIKTLEQVGRRTSSLAKDLRGAGSDAFALSAKIAATNKAMMELDVQTLMAPETVIAVVSDECVQESTEFWGHFAEAAKAEGWEVCGHTNRRLLARGLFIELKSDVLQVEDMGRATPHVPALVPKLRSVVSELMPTESCAQDLLDLLARAYDDTPGGEEKPMEQVFRNAVMLWQTPGFWGTPTAGKFKSLTRPMFRARLAAIMQRQLRTSDGRSIRLGTTLEAKDRWEIYSPGEGAVVQVGRVSFVKE